MDRDSEKIFINDVKNRLAQLNSYNTPGQAFLNPSDAAESRLLNNFLSVIEQKEKKIAMLEAKLEAETTVKDRFKELYVSAVVGKALKDEGVEV